jgi:hypothetical protein
MTLHAPTGCREKVLPPLGGRRARTYKLGGGTPACRRGRSHDPVPRAAEPPLATPWNGTHSGQPEGWGRGRTRRRPPAPGCVRAKCGAQPECGVHGVGRSRPPKASSPTTRAWAESRCASTTPPSTTWARTGYSMAPTSTPPRPGQRSAEGLPGNPPSLPLPRGPGPVTQCPDQNPSTFQGAIGRRSFRQPAVSSPTTLGSGR